MKNSGSTDPPIVSIKSCGNRYPYCKICRPDITATLTSPFAVSRSREAGKRAMYSEKRRQEQSKRMLCLWSDPEWAQNNKSGGRPPIYVGCLVDKCKEEHVSHEYCSKHYQRWRIYGNPIAPLKVRKWLGGICAVDDCEKEHLCSGYCQMHWARVKKNGEPGQAASLHTNERHKGCFVEGCEEPHCAKGFCKGHYGTLITSPQRRALKRGSKSRLKPKQWLVKLKEYDNRCAYCGVQNEDIQQDHIRPLSKGGHHTITNVVPACGFCNRRKHDYVNKYLPMRPDVISACFSLAPQPTLGV